MKKKRLNEWELFIIAKGNDKFLIRDVTKTQHLKKLLATQTSKNENFPTKVNGFKTFFNHCYEALHLMCLRGSWLHL